MVQFTKSYECMSRRFEVRVLVYVLYVAGMQSYKVASKSRSVAVSVYQEQEFGVCARV